MSCADRAHGAALVRTVPASCADGDRTADYPVGADASSDKLRRCARCTKCGSKGATLQHPEWMVKQIGFTPLPVPKFADECPKSFIVKGANCWPLP
jgi:hypothetical protein